MNLLSFLVGMHLSKQVQEPENLHLLHLFSQHMDRTKQGSKGHIWLETVKGLQKLATEFSGMIINYGEQRLHMLGMANCHNWPENAEKYWICSQKRVGVWQHQGHHGGMAWRFFFLPTTMDNNVKGSPLWRHHRAQWHVYVAEIWISAIHHS